MTLHSVIVNTEWNWLCRICGEQWQCFVGFEVLTASTSFWDTTPCIAVEVSYSRSWAPLATCLSFGFLLYLFFHPEDEGTTFLRNDGELLSVFSASRPRTLQSFSRSLDKILRRCVLCGIQTKDAVETPSDINFNFISLLSLFWKNKRRLMRSLYYSSVSLYPPLIFVWRLMRSPCFLCPPPPIFSSVYYGITLLPVCMALLIF
jgi:hypothetical protein